MATPTERCQTVRARRSGPSPLPNLPASRFRRLVRRRGLFPPRDRYSQSSTALKRVGFVTCSDLCGVDYLTNLDRPLPEGVAAERFEVVVDLLVDRRGPPGAAAGDGARGRPDVPTLFFLYPGTENMEREAYDMFGVRFEGHPDPTRILMPEDWEGHPLRRDYGVGRVPVQFKDAPGPR